MWHCACKVMYYLLCSMWSNEQNIKKIKKALVVIYTSLPAKLDRLQKYSKNYKIHIWKLVLIGTIKVTSKIQGFPIVSQFS